MNRTFVSRLSLSIVLCAALTSLPAVAQSDKAAAPPAAAPAAAAPAAGADAMEGLAAVYTTRLHGRTTASGARYNKNALTAAHMTLPMGSMVRVTRVSNKRSVVVIVNDRGPTQAGRVLDLSTAAAARLGMHRPGLMKVTLAVVGKAKPHRAHRKG